jgi:hypothetical protein
MKEAQLFHPDPHIDLTNYSYPQMLAQRLKLQVVILHLERQLDGALPPQGQTE